MTARLQALKEDTLTVGALGVTAIVALAVAAVLAGAPAWIAGLAACPLLGGWSHWAQRFEFASAARERWADVAWRIRLRLERDDDSDELDDLEELSDEDQGDEE